jgi:NitT/TauT family transport system substrate-binding protein
MAVQRISSIVLATSIAVCGCGDESTRRDAAGIAGAANGGATIVTGGAAGAVNAAGASGGKAAPASDGSGGSVANGGAGGTPGFATGGAGGNPTMTGGAATASGGSAGTPGAGGAPASGGRGGSSGAYANLAVFGNTTTLELTPVLVATKSDYPGKATVMNGGIPNLWTGADLATNAETQALVQSVTHSNLRIVFTVCEGIYRIVARRSAGITSLGDLRGKRIATLPSTSSAYFLHAMLATVQLGETDVTVVSSGSPSQIPGLLSSRQVDAATIWEPEIQNAADALASDAIEFQDKTVYRELFDLHTTAEKLANQTTRRSIVEFLRALVKASNDIVAQPSSQWPLAASTTGFDATLIAKSWKNEAFPGTLVPDVLDVLEQEEIWLAKNSGRTARARAELAKLIDESPLMEAMGPP